MKKISYKNNFSYYLLYSSFEIFMLNENLGNILFCVKNESLFCEKTFHSLLSDFSFNCGQISQHLFVDYKKQNDENLLNHFAILNESSRMLKCVYLVDRKSIEIFKNESISLKFDISIALDREIFYDSVINSIKTCTLKDVIYIPD